MHLAPRTSLLTLVVIAPDAETANAANHLIDVLPSHHPSRSIIVVPIPNAEESRIDAQLAAHCHFTQGAEHPVCCEDVMLTVAGPAARHLHSVILPLLIPDLPVYVWWDSPELDNDHVVGEIMESTDRFIIDSSHMSWPERTLPRLDYFNSSNPSCAIGDLEWQRLGHWRHGIARHSETPALRPFFGSVNAVEITTTQGIEGRAPVQAFLLLGWLSLRHGWGSARIIRDAPGRLSAVRDVPEVRIRLQTGDYDGVEPGSLVSVVLHGSHDDQSAVVSVRRGDDPLHLVFGMTDPRGTHEHHARIEAVDPGTMLAHELDAPPLDAEYGQVLKAALPFLAAHTA